uniref:Uncharacterized protein n=1 Tax=Sinocyclocheilus grahami TaxID=75366 RepID=A0A672QKZ9_SINGR
MIGRYQRTTWSKQHLHFSIVLHGSVCLFDCRTLLINSLNGSGQSPAHLAACGGQAYCLLWLLQTGAAHPWNLFIPQKTAEDIAWSCGFEECGRFLNMHRRTQDLKNASLSSLTERHILRSTLAGQKRGCECSSAQDGKKARDCV